MSCRGLSYFRRTSVVAMTAAVLVGVLTPAASSGPVAPGAAKASASVASVVPAVGGLDLAARVGASAAEVANNIARAQAQAIDLGPARARSHR